MQQNKQVNSQKQQQKLAPKQLHYLNIVRLNNQEMDQYIIDEAYMNPFLEVEYKTPENTLQTSPTNVSYESTDGSDDQGIPDYLKEHFRSDFSPSLQSIGDDEQRHQFLLNNFQVELDGIDLVKSQVDFYFHSDEDKKCAHFIIDSLDDHGLLHQSIEDLTDDISFRHNKFFEEDYIANIIEIIKDIDGLGVASHDVKDYLIYQIENRKHPDKKVLNLALDIVRNHTNSIGNMNISSLTEKLSCTEAEIYNAMDVIKSLQAYPIVQNSNQEPIFIQTDYIIQMDQNGDLRAYTSRNYVDVKFSNDNAYTAISGKDKSADKYIQETLHKAEELVEIVANRKKTMSNVIQVIAELQSKYFHTGNIMDLIPMTLQDIADKTGYDVSTLSRATSTKYVETPFGTIDVKSLFSGKVLSASGNTYTPNQLKEMIREMIENENRDQVYTDTEISEMLFDQGIEVSRRSVANYRKEMGIDNSENRKAGKNV